MGDRVELGEGGSAYGEAVQDWSAKGAEHLAEIVVLDHNRHHCAGCGIADTTGWLEPEADAAHDSGDEAVCEDELAATVAEERDVEASRCFELLQPTRTNATTRPTAGAIIRMGQDAPGVASSAGSGFYRDCSAPASIRDEA